GFSRDWSSDVCSSDLGGPAGRVSTPVLPWTPSMTPLERYQADLKRPDFFHDPAQENAVKHLQRLYDDILRAGPPRSVGLFGRFRAKRSLPVKGLYFWGGVGRGTSYRAATCFDARPRGPTMPTQFPRFMQRGHQELHELNGEKNPLKIIARKFVDEARVICFDEFFVTAITHAMILGTLMEE